MVKKVETPQFSPDETMLLDFLKKEKSATIKELSYALDKSSSGIVELAQVLRDKGIAIWKKDEAFYLGEAEVDFSPEDIEIQSHEIRIGFISDTVLGSKAEQPTNLCKAFQIAEEMGVSIMIHLGVSAGKPTPKKQSEFHAKTSQAQIDYIVKNYPRSDKFKTRFISGHHDMQWREGKEPVNILAEVCMRRDDLIYRGDWYSDFPLRRIGLSGKRCPILKAAYHGGDDSPYSKAYPVQGYANNLIQDFKDLLSASRIDIGVVGGQGTFLDLSGGVVPHLLALPGMRGVAASTLRKKKRAVVPTVGFVILIVKIDEKNKLSVVKEQYPLECITKDYLEKFSDDKLLTDGMTSREQKVLKILEASPQSAGELSQALNCSSETVVSVIESLKGFGFDIIQPDDNNPSKNYKLLMGARIRFRAPKINFKNYFQTTQTYGAVSDTHFGHKTELLKILNEAYDVFAERGIKFVSHLGDIVNGFSKHNEYLMGEVTEDRATPLVQKVIEKYPHRDGIKTVMISGDHDGWYTGKIGYDILNQIAMVRKDDIVKAGNQRGEWSDSRLITSMRHYNWGTGYSRSYKPQGVIEELLKDVQKMPNKHRGKTIMFLSGGGHVYCAMMYKGVVFILMPCLQGKTGFITGLGKSPDVGFVVYSLTWSSNGTLTRFSVEYFDRSAKAMAMLPKQTKTKIINLQKLK